VNRIRTSLPLLALGLMLTAGVAALAIDPPHNIATANSYGTLNYCSTCHKIHGAVGGTLTTVSGNTNLCLSCHVSGGLATNKAFAASDQAVPAAASLVGSTAGGTSHRWDSSAAGRIIKGSPNTSTGTITPSGDYTGAYAATIKLRVAVAGATGTAQVAWSQTTNGTATFGAETTFTTSTAAQALGSSGVSVAFSSTGTFVLNDIFYLYVRPDLVNPTSAMAGHLEGGKAMCSTCHDQHLQAQAPFDPTSSQTYTPGTTNNRHFQRVANDTGSLCGDCHAPRNVGKGGTSHPVHVNLAAAPNTKTPTLGAVLSAAGNVECLTCHDIHGAPTATTPAGMLLRVSNSTTLCADCHTLADTTTANTHVNPTSGILWPGDQYGGSTYAAYTLAADRGACKNCHTPHGWPDANNPGGKYALALGAQQNNLCETCHDSNGPSTKDVRTEITKSIHHPVERTSGRLVGCADCHNPHMATAGVHTYATTADANRNRLRAAAGGVLNNMYALRGVDGVAFNYTGLALWTAPTTANFTKIAGGSPTVAASGAEFEYQVCMKCHTSYSWGTNPAPAGITSGGTSSLTLVNGSTQPWVAGTGTAKFTNASTTVTGTGTSWTTANMVGQYIRPTGGTVNTYRVTAVASTTSLTISSSFGQTTTASVAYETRDAAAIMTTTAPQVTGYGTTWTSALVNQFFAMTSGNTTSYRISAVPSGTSLTLATTPTTSTTPQDFYLHPGASFTNASTAVVGYGTAWTSAMVGSTIQASGQAGTNVIASVTDATHLTLTATYTGTTGIYRYLLAGPITLQETDVAMEFNPANRSGHPVVASLNSYTGNTAPKALAAATMKAPWTAVGTQTMMCSDCHNTDAASPAAQGPHGSAAQFMLRGTNAANWPNVTLSSGTTSWCANCHTLTLSNNGVHTQGNHSGYQCYRCHVVIPHGSKRSRLIGDRNNMPARYAYQNNLSNMDITGFTKGNPSTSYSEGNCGVGSGCYSSHTSAGSEPW